MKPIYQQTSAGLSFLQKGTSPQVLVLSGMHGDEHAVVPIVQHYIETHFDVLPDFVYLPTVSPSAYTAKTRMNMYGHDINREFKKTSTDPEARMCMEFLRQFTFERSLDFHEDTGRESSFYFYDTGEFSETSLTHIRKSVLTTGATLHHGIDDPDDPTLGCQVLEGYVPKSSFSDIEDFGFSTTWMVKNNITRRAFTFEIPGKTHESLKSALIEQIYTLFLKA
jgi:predicted deacylase